MSKEYDFVVVGAGTVGRSTALYLHLQYPKARCALIEQFKFNHEQGSSHSKVRIVRSAYVHSFYRDLCIMSQEVSWPEVEKVLKNRFLMDTPFLAYVEDDRQFQEYD